MTAKLTWMDPPPAQGATGHGMLAPFMDELKANPGKWALLPIHPTNSLVAVWRRQYRPEFEFTCRDIGKTASRVVDHLYVRYIGDKS